jgi:CRP-like cAMP-binding protein
MGQSNAQRATYGQAFGQDTKETEYLGEQSLIGQNTTELISPANLASYRELLANQLLRQLSEAAFARLIHSIEPVYLSAGQILYETGNRAEFAYFPEGAVVSYLYFLQDGSTAEAAMVGQEGMVGLSMFTRTTQPGCWAQVTLAGTAVRVKSQILQNEFGRGEDLHDLMLSYAGNRMNQIARRAVCNIRHGVEKRLATWLLMLRDRINEDILLLTHEEISRHLSARRAGVTTCLINLRQAGVINARRGIIEVTDPVRLRDAACECYQFLGV